MTDGVLARGRPRTPARALGVRPEVVAHLVPGGLAKHALRRQLVVMDGRHRGSPPALEPGHDIRVHREVAPEQDLAAVLPGEGRVVRQDLRVDLDALTECGDDVERPNRDIGGHDAMAVDGQGILDRLEVLEALLQLRGPGLVAQHEGEPEERLCAEEVVVVLLVGADDHVQPAERATNPCRVTGLVVVGQEVPRALAQERRQVGVVRRDRFGCPPEVRGERLNSVRPGDRVRHGVERLSGALEQRREAVAEAGMEVVEHGMAAQGREVAPERSARSCGERPCGGRGSPAGGPDGPRGRPRSRRPRSPRGRRSGPRRTGRPAGTACARSRASSRWGRGRARAARGGRRSASDDPADRGGPADGRGRAAPGDAGCPRRGPVIASPASRSSSTAPRSPVAEPVERDLVRRHQDLVEDRAGLIRAPVAAR